MKMLTPLIVDLDGTLISTDSLIESIILLVKKNPIYFFFMLFWLKKGKAHLKTEIATRISLDIETLPYNTHLIEWLKTEKEKGRQIYLATAAHKTIAAEVAKYLNIFDDFFASERNCNLKGSTKCALIKNKIGDDFVYAGDSQADLPIWEEAKAAVLVNVSTTLARQVRKEAVVEAEFPRKKIGIKTWVRGLRIHQWVKNTLLFVPLLTAFEFLDIFKVFSVSFAFLSYSFVASGTYILNDIWDLKADRVHTRKRHRPFASGEIPIINGLVMVGVLFILALIIAMCISTAFVTILFAYFILTSVYSLFLKQHAIVDTIMLSLLYTLRIVAGVIVIKVSISSWLLAFSMFLFLSLALIKRCGELVSTENIVQIKAISGRDYRSGDLVVLWPFGVGASLSAIVIFGLFISSLETQQRYASPDLLWFSAIGVMYWLGRMWIKTSRGEMHDDPIVYVIKDKVSYVLLISIIIITVTAYFHTFSFTSTL